MCLINNHTKATPKRNSTLSLYQVLVLPTFYLQFDRVGWSPNPHASSKNLGCLPRTPVGKHMSVMPWKILTIACPAKILICVDCYMVTTPMKQLVNKHSQSVGANKSNNPSLPLPAYLRMVSNIHRAVSSFTLYG